MLHANEEAAVNVAGILAASRLQHPRARGIAEARVSIAKGRSRFKQNLAARQDKSIGTPSGKSPSMHQKLFRDQTDQSQLKIQT